MGTNWTKDQEAVINHRSGNLLVAAAAGSGKTAVLSERIIAMLTDSSKPINVDEFLVVTFTRAAAAEMKERIGKKISEYVTAHPDNRHMQRQSALLHNSSITTIDSFCLQTVREFFHVIDMDPSFRIGDDAEMAILKKDILTELLEEKYEEADPDFLNFSECYAGGRSDDAIEKLILDLYEAAQSNPYPDKWLEESIKDGSFSSLEELNANRLVRSLVSNVAVTMNALAVKADRALAISREPDGPIQYEESFILEARMMREVAAAKTYTEMSAKMAEFEFQALSRKKSPDESKKAAAKSIRDDYKKFIVNLKNRYFDLAPEQIIEVNNLSMASTELLVKLALEFSRRFNEAKAEKGIYSFNDIEHFALYILTVKGPEGEPSPAADALRERYAEIIIDEYQDSNLLQETILNAISREKSLSAEYPDGQPNMFMVGDVKQSIYRFRRARPELFMDKYENYPDTGLYRKIILKMNFRSRRQVLDGANVIFEWCMHREFGRIEYDAEAALYPGNIDYTDVDNEKYNPDLIIIEKPEDAADALSDGKYREAYSTAQYIKKLMADPDFRVTKKNGPERPSYGDFAVLLRSTGEWIESFSRVLSDEGIPVRAEVKTGLFETGEVKTALNYLRCLDNPKQDIPLVALLYSPLLHLSNDELAGIVKKGEFVYNSLRDFVKADAEPGSSEAQLQDRLKAFLDSFEFLRERRKVLPISLLLDEVYRLTGLYKIMLALPAGERRAANLDFLREQSVKFEKTSYSGLFNFIRYVENLKEHEIDFGEASAGGLGDAVRIMTIHGSKGLEFPIVIIPQITKGFNFMDSMATAVIHPEFGPGLNYVNPVRRVKQKTLRKNFIAQDLINESIAEELRVFYVALTRAREKLALIVSANGSVEKLLEKQNETGDVISYDSISKAGSYFDFIKGCLLPADEAGRALLLEQFAQKGCAEISKKSVTTGRTVTWHISREMGMNKPLALVQELADTAEAMAYVKNLFDAPSDLTGSSDYKAVKAAIEFRYPYERLVTEPLKHSVSELKHKAMADAGIDPFDSGAAAPWVENSENEAGGRKATGAERGTAMHRIMELLPFEKPMSESEIREHLASLVEKNLMSEDDAALVNTAKVESFTQSSLYRRMCLAKANKGLFREQPFVYGYRVEGGDDNDLSLVQGVIDAYFEEDGQYVILDYKTDRASFEELAKRYTTQLDLYEQALCRISGKQVKQKLIWSFFNGSEIEL